MNSILKLMFHWLSYTAIYAYFLDFVSMLQYFNTTLKGHNRKLKGHNRKLGHNTTLKGHSKLLKDKESINNKNANNIRKLFEIHYSQG